MTWPHKPVEDFSPDEAPVTWGVEKDPHSADRSPAGRVIWIIITILIILSLILPWLVPYLSPRRPPVDPEIIALAQYVLCIN